MLFNLKYFLTRAVFYSVFVILFLLFPGLSEAATISIAPSTQSVSVGNIFTVQVLVNTLNQYINNGEAVIQFPTDMLEVVSLTKGSSIFSLWVEEPRYSNTTGKITFNGGVANPGYNGAGGSVASITFRAKKTGNASIIFTDGAVRANDGLGTNILTNKISGSVQIVAAKVPAPTVEKDEDTNPPEIFTPTARIFDNRNILKLNAKDSGSGIDYYTVQIDGGQILTVRMAELVDYEYTLPYLNSGSHGLFITVYDKAGNKREASLEIISPLISSPQISLSSNEIIKGETVVISGTSDYPGKQVVVTVESMGKEVNRYTQKAGGDGTFSIVADDIDVVGVVDISAENILSDKVKSSPSSKLYLTVTATKFVKLTSVIAGLIFISLLLFLLLIASYVGWHRFFGLRNKIRLELKDTAREIHKATLLLKDELNDQLQILEKIKVDRSLNKKEEAVFKEIEKNIDQVEKFVDEQLKKLI